MSIDLLLYIKIKQSNIIEKLKLIKQMKYSKLQDLLDSNPQIDNIIKNIDYKYNNIQHQTGNSECGVYSINFIIRLLNKEKFNLINFLKVHRQPHKRQVGPSLDYHTFPQSYPFISRVSDRLEH